MLFTYPLPLSQTVTPTQTSSLRLERDVLYVLYASCRNLKLLTDL